MLLVIPAQWMEKVHFCIVTYPQVRGKKTRTSEWKNRKEKNPSHVKCMTKVVESTVKEFAISHLTSTASSMTVMSVLHLAEGLMASSAGGMTKLLLRGSHIPSPKVYVNLQKGQKAKGPSNVRTVKGRHEKTSSDTLRGRYKEEHVLGPTVAQHVTRIPHQRSSIGIYRPGQASDKQSKDWLSGDHNRNHLYWQSMKKKKTKVICLW